MRIAVYTMAKNESTHVDRFAATTQGADYVVVTDTGSTDGTPDLLRDKGIAVQSARILPWRFDTATNCALAHVPEDVDVCIKLDLDEVLWVADGHWRDELERVWASQQGRVRQFRYWYTWSWHVPGQIPAVRFRASNIHARTGFVWRHPGHSALCSTTPGSSADLERLEIHHYMTDKSRPDYLPLLQQGVQENRCPRTLFYLGREYSFRRMYAACQETLQAYLDHPDAGWRAERAEAMRHIAHTYEAQEAFDAAMSWLLRAQCEYPGTRDLWWEILRFLNARQDYAGASWAGHKCLAITQRDRQWVGQTGSAWREDPFVLTAESDWHQGLAQRAAATARQALDSFPASQRVQDLLQMIGI